MSGKQGALSTKPTALPESYQPMSRLEIDWRCKAGREYAGDALALTQDLGGRDVLSTQELTLVERTVFLRRQCLAFESAVINGTKPPMTPGEYSNFANVLAGYLAKLGLKRRARPAKSLHEYMAAKAAESQSGGDGSR